MGPMPAKRQKTTACWVLPDGSFAVFVPGNGKRLSVEAVADRPPPHDPEVWRFTAGQADVPIWAKPLDKIAKKTAGRLLIYRPTRRLVMRVMSELKVDEAGKR